MLRIDRVIKLDNILMILMEYISIYLLIFFAHNFLWLFFFLGFMLKEMSF